MQTSVMSTMKIKFKKYKRHGWKEATWKIGEFGFNELIISERSMEIVS